jgi:1-acyl-sn-glycerol-3-phosphate acyltransferase
VTSENTLTIEDPRDQETYAFELTLFRRVLVGTLRILLRFFMQRNVIGMEKLPSEGPVILASNHLTNFDVFTLQLVFMRPLFFMAKSELYKNPIVAAGLRQVGAFPVLRGQRDQWAIRHAEKVLEHNQVLAMFPEGTRSKGKGLRAGKTGVARLALKTGCPIIPIAISGTEKMFKTFPRRTPIEINIGEHISPQPNESTLGLTDRMMFAIADLLPPDLRGVYAKRPAGFE